MWIEPFRFLLTAEIIAPLTADAVYPELHLLKPSCMHALVARRASAERGGRNASAAEVAHRPFLPRPGGLPRASAAGFYDAEQCHRRGLRPLARYRARRGELPFGSSFRSLKKPPRTIFASHVASHVATRESAHFTNAAAINNTRDMHLFGSHGSRRPCFGGHEERSG